MRVHVDRSICQLHGQCEIVAPEVFAINDDGELEYDAEPGEERRAEVEDAADACPTQAITVTDQ